MRSPRICRIVAIAQLLSGKRTCAIVLRLFFPITAWRQCNCITSFRKKNLYNRPKTTQHKNVTAAPTLRNYWKKKFAHLCKSSQLHTRSFLFDMISKCFSFERNCEILARLQKQTCRWSFYVVFAQLHNSLLATFAPRCRNFSIICNYQYVHFDRAWVSNLQSVS